MSARRGKKGSFGPGIDSKDEDEVREVVYASDNAYTDLETEEDEEEEKPRKTVTRKSIMTRAITAWILIGTYMLVLRAGHFYCIMTGVLTQVELFRELVNVRYVPAKDRKVPLFRTLQWGWFFAAMMWAYGEAIHRFCTEHGSFQSIIEFTQYTPQATFVVYCILFVISTLTLRQSQVRFQISQYMWTIVIICLVVLQCKYFAMYTLKGLFWYFFPMACVVMNDVSAYFCGITMGKKFIKKPFIKLSPNKTWEGFLGAAVLTMLFSFFFPALLARFTWLTCPAETIQIAPFPSELHCTPHSVFVSAEYDFINMPFVGSALALVLGETWKVLLLPMQVQGLAYGLFASLIAPFGGFFASGIKRAYGIKDFDNFMPGHGGMMDRMDCQLFMMAFTSFHYNYFIKSAIPTVEYMMYKAVSMSSVDQMRLIAELKKLV